MDTNKLRKGFGYANGRLAQLAAYHNALNDCCDLIDSLRQKLQLHERNDEDIKYREPTWLDLALTLAAKDVLYERLRQIDVEGWTPGHDDSHKGGDLAMAGACYACAAATWIGTRHQIPDSDYPKLVQHGFRWPWEAKWWKPKSPRRDLVKAAALLIAEIERLDRAELKSPNA